MTIKIDLSGCYKKLDQIPKQVQAAVEQQVLKDSNAYIPADTWALRDSSLSTFVPGSGKITWQTPYARRLYYGIRFNFSRDKNPHAQPLWFEKAKAIHGKDWVFAAKKAVKD